MRELEMPYEIETSLGRVRIFEDPETSSGKNWELI